MTTIRDIVYDEYKHKKNEWNKTMIIIFNKLYEIGRGLFPDIVHRIMKDYNDLSIYPPEKFFDCKTRTTKELLKIYEMVNDDNVDYFEQLLPANQRGTFNMKQQPPILASMFSSSNYKLRVTDNTLLLKDGTQTWCFTISCNRTRNINKNEKTIFNVYCSNGVGTFLIGADCNGKFPEILLLLWKIWVCRTHYNVDEFHNRNEIIQIIHDFACSERDFSIANGVSLSGFICDMGF
jgi:hypothetical protein